MAAALTTTAAKVGVSVAASAAGGTVSGMGTQILSNALTKENKEVKDYFEGIGKAAVFGLTAGAIGGGLGTLGGQVGKEVAMKFAD